MDPDRCAEWAARVAAWQQRDPLARRIAPAEVGDFGWVDLPFAGGGPRESWRAVFSESVLPGIGAARIAAWALRHGQETQPDADEPLHQVAVDRRLLPGQGEAAMLWLVRASVRASGGQTTLLLDPRPGGPILGRRLRSRRRYAAVAGAMLGVFGLTSSFAWVVANGRDRADAEPAAVALAASAASAASSPAAASAGASGVVTQAASASASASAPASASTRSPATQATAASAPVAVAAVSSAPAGGATVPAAASAATTVAATAPARRTDAAAAGPASAASSPRPAPSAPASSATISAAPAAVAPLRPPVEPLVSTGRIVDDKPQFLDEADRIAERTVGEAARAAAAARRVERLPVAWALAGPAVRTSAEAQLAGDDLALALKSAGAGRCPRIDALPAGDNWRPVCWAFARRAEGEALRAALGARGKALELVEF